MEAIVSGDIHKVAEIRQRNKGAVIVLRKSNSDTFEVSYSTPAGPVTREGTGEYTPIGDEIGRLIIRVSVQGDKQ